MPVKYCKIINLLQAKKGIPKVGSAIDGLGVTLSLTPCSNIYKMEDILPFCSKMQRTSIQSVIT